ncbi:PREDICTED: protein NUCLEAR FUSION DEFECTIVE 6, chloroplastic/mitochondrial-like isoform X1 [Lupinus angustifolius]|uniref:protein NUCLEAR FUSION DEFECTIVE 6, chloroplastic/mitochondrial-like isoform X1 n=1 Tax=Lupinus angustifolius TaxID=3871 RepID=UPI00092EC933|nr:PREDICTED: protein NUCLEAR FUSION DEFECTIVE 6, chloroplastic/mitochondrial-like isoform X1 [Lupinus angustifolius]
MASVAGAAAVRTVIRSCSTRCAAFHLGSEAKSAHSPFRMASNKPLSQSMPRRRVESSFCVESMLPYHTATASALVTSMLSVSRGRYGWLLEDCNDDVLLSTKL